MTRHDMQWVLANAGPMPIFGRLIVAGLGFALTFVLTRRVVSTAPTTLRVCLSLCIVFVLVVGSLLLGDDRAVLAFVVGALGGVAVVARSASVSWTSLRRSWRLVGACLIVGPAFGVALFFATDLFTSISPLDRMSYFSIFLIIGSLAGVLGAGIVSVVGSLNVRRDA
jgi:hypothetical protein